MNKVKYTFSVVMIALCLLPAVLFAQAQNSVKVAGKVTDNKSGELLTGVNIVIKGTQSGSITDVNGKYVIGIKRRNPDV